MAKVKIKIDKEEIEDNLIQPLNNITLLAYETSQKEEINKEVARIINILVEANIIPERRRK